MNTPFKTPVSFLEELCIKRGITPTYQDLQNGAPSHIPTFIFEVTCKDFITQGQGRSKREAKHAAAEKMLEKLKNCPDFNFDEETNRIPITDDTAVPSPYEHKLKENAVGSLTDYCAEYKLPKPIYKFIREEGPAHNKRFTKQCFVKTFAVEATERTKKQAKQVVALQMISFLKSTIDPRAKRELAPTNLCEYDDFQQALAEFPNCCTTFLSKFHPGDLSCEIINHYVKYEENYEQYKESILELTQSATENPGEKLNALLEIIDTKYSLIPVKSNDPNLFIVILNVDFSPTLSVYNHGSCYIEASRKAATKALQNIRTLCFPNKRSECKKEKISREEFVALISSKRKQNT